MSIHPTRDNLKTLRLTGMARTLQEQMAMPRIRDLTFEERLGLVIDREVTERENRRLNSRLKRARLRQQACIEDIDDRHPRGLDKSLMAQLATCAFSSKSAVTSSSPASQAAAKPTSPVPSPKKPAAKATPPSTSVCHVSSQNSTSPRGMPVMANSSPPSPKWTSLSSTTGALSPSTTNTARASRLRVDDLRGRLASPWALHVVGRLSFRPVAPDG